MGASNQLAMAVPAEVATVQTLLKASRPGWWLVTFWMYILPTAQQPAVFATARFWLGLLYCTLPLNMLVYVWNDYADYDYDQRNLRKPSACAPMARSMAKMASNSASRAVDMQWKRRYPSLTASLALSGVSSKPAGQAIGAAADGTLADSNEDQNML